MLAHMMAMENPKMITAEAVEAMEFPELADKHGVHGVPHTAINDGREHVVGAVPEGNLLAAIQRVAASI
jgi:predicted DsbA family dithiol-disulfide isomerase